MCEHTAVDEQDARTFAGFPCWACSLSLAQRKERKETSTPNKLPPILGSLIDFEQKPLYIKVLVKLTEPLPRWGEF